MSNLFENPTKKDEKARAKATADAIAAHNETIAKAQRCLNSDLFQDYKKSLDANAEKLFNLFCDTPSKDPVTESLRIRINSMRDLGIRVYQETLKKPITPAKPEEEAKKP